MDNLQLTIDNQSRLRTRDLSRNAGRLGILSDGSGADGAGARISPTGGSVGDTVRLPSGRIVSEERHTIESGRTPVTNNLIGRMIKQMVGYYRHMTAGDGGGDGGGTAA